MDATILPRFVARSLVDRLRVMPAVVVTGARQTGKSTLVQDLVSGRRSYFSPDDLDVVDAARPRGAPRRLPSGDPGRGTTRTRPPAGRQACHRLGQLLNQTELGRDVASPQPTVRRYLNLPETSYLLVRLPAFSVNRTKRLIKSPKVYWRDTGAALHWPKERSPAECTSRTWCCTTFWPGAMPASNAPSR